MCCVAAGSACLIHCVKFILSRVMHALHVVLRSSFVSNDLLYSVRGVFTGTVAIRISLSAPCLSLHDKTMVSMHYFRQASRLCILPHPTFIIILLLRVRPPLGRCRAVLHP